MKEVHPRPADVIASAWPCTILVYGFSACERCYNDGVLGKMHVYDVASYSVGLQYVQVTNAGPTKGPYTKHVQW